MASATIKLFLPHGDPKRLRTAEISNWSGKALGCPRTDLDELLERDEMQQSGVYILTGTDADTGRPAAYIGEAEVLASRLKTHRGLDFWVNVIVFVSKDENLTKSHIRYLEGRLIAEAQSAARHLLQNSVASGSRLPEADRHDMEEFLVKVQQLLPVLGSEVLTPLVAPEPLDDDVVLRTEIKGLVATGRRTPSGFVVLRTSEAVGEHRPTAPQYAPFAVALREQFLSDGTLVRSDGHLVFSRDVEFTSPSSAAAVIQGGTANGMTAWKDSRGRTLKEIEEQ